MFVHQQKLIIRGDRRRYNGKISLSRFDGNKWERGTVNEDGLPVLY